MDFIERFLDVVFARPSDIVLIWKLKHWTNANLLAEVDDMIDALSDAGAQPGDSISISMPNSPNLAISILACLRAGFVAAPINTRFKASETRAVFDLIKPTLHLGSGESTADLFGVSTQTLLPESRVILAAEDKAADVIRAARCSTGNRVRSRSSDFGQPAILMPTSGTTGTPKVVVHTSDTLGAIAERYDAMGLQPEDVMLNVGSMVHASGLFNLLASLIRPGPMVTVGPFKADDLLDAIALHRCTWIKALPFAFAELVDAQKEQRRDVSSLRFCLASGDAAPEQIQRDFAATFGLPLHAGWASTEAATSLVYSSPEKSAYSVRANSSMMLRALEGESAVASDTGEMLVRGPHVSPGYWSEGALRAGPAWFETGDIFQRLEDHTLSFIARRKNLIVRGGSNISPLEVEEALRAHPGVSDAAVFGIPDDRLGQRVAALIELLPTCISSAADVLSQTRDRISGYKVPEFARIVPQLPRNGNGKIDRSSLSQILGNAITPALINT